MSKTIHCGFMGADYTIDGESRTGFGLEIPKGFGLKSALNWYAKESPKYKLVETKYFANKYDAPLMLGRFVEKGSDKGFLLAVSFSNKAVVDICSDYRDFYFKYNGVKI